MTDLTSSPTALKQQRTPSNSGVPRSTKNKTPQSKLEQAEKIDDTKASIQEEVESQADTSNVEEGSEADEEEGTEVIPAGTVSDGAVLDKNGLTIGRVKGDASELEGSIVDEEGDILDSKGNIIGTAELHSANSAKPDLTAPFGVQDNGDITNAKGSVVGKLSEGKPQDLVGTAITSIGDDGVMKAETGTALGKAELQSDLLDDKSSDGGLSEKADSAIELKDEETTKADIPEDSKSQNLPSGIGSKGAPLDAASKLSEEAAAPEVDSPSSEGVKDLDPEDSASQVEVAAEDAKDSASQVEVAAEDVKDSSPKDSASQVEVAAEDAKDSASQVEVATEDAKDLSPKDSASQVEVAAEDVKDSSPKDSASQVEVAAEDAKDSTSQAEVAAEDVKDSSPKDSASQIAGNDASSKQPAPEDAASQAPDATDAVPEPDTEETEKLDELDPKAVDEADIEQESPELPDLSILKGMKVNKLGKVVNQDGVPFGQLVSGDVKKLYGKRVDAKGQIWDDSGKVIGTAEVLPEDERLAEEPAPFEDFPDSTLDIKGNVIFEGKVVGRLIEGDPKKLEGKKIDADGAVLDRNGNILGKAERYQEEEIVPVEEAPEEPVDLSLLEGKKVNKGGFVVDDHNKLFGRVVSGEVSKLIGKKVDREGKIWSESGKVIGSAELLSVDDRDQLSSAPFEDFPGALIEKTGNVVFEGQVVGRLIEGDAKKLAGKTVDPDGEVIDRVGNVLGKAERWTEEEAPEPEKKDLSALAGMKVNKAGNLVDSHGTIYGRVVPGSDVQKLIGKSSDKNGQIWDASGNVVGQAELVPESERAGLKEGPFTGFNSPTVTKEGKVADSKGVIIGRLIEGEAKKLYGKIVDPDGDVLDGNGNTIGKAERWEEEVKEKAHSPVEGRKVNREGNVVDEGGDLIAKLTDGDITKCAGKEIDADGDVYNSKGQVIGHVTLLGEIPEPEPEPEPETEEEPEPVVEEPKETPEEAEARHKKEEEEKQAEADRKLAGRMSFTIQETLDKMNPLLKNIMDEIDVVERQKEEERDEQKLVDKVKPMIEEGGRILTETNGIIRGMDPDGRITANAKQKAATREATPEEHHLAEVLKELTGNVTQTIEKAKKKIAGMPHAKKELNPLWGLLAEPLGQILAAVGLLLSGVLGLVGRLLQGLGLGGLLDNLLGGLGIKGILKGLGLGTLTSALTGRK